MVIKVYYSSITATLKLEKQQKHIFDVLSSKKFNHEKIDIAQSEEYKQKMRDGMGDPAGLAPQIFKDDMYIGTYEKFAEAVENEELETFLQESPES